MRRFDAGSTRAPTAMRRFFWERYGTTMRGLVRHHGEDPKKFIVETHQFPELSSMVVGENALGHALARLGGTRLVFSNAPRHYVEGVLRALGRGALVRRGLHHREHALPAEARVPGLPRTAAGAQSGGPPLRADRRHAGEPARGEKARHVNRLGERRGTPLAVCRPARQISHGIAAAWSSVQLADIRA